MVGTRKKESLKKTEQINVYLTKNEDKQIAKKANHAVMGKSVFIRKTLIEALNIKIEDEA